MTIWRDDVGLLEVEKICYFCGGALEDPDEAYCFGCRVFICEDCMLQDEEPLGSHEPEDHGIKKRRI